MVPRDPSATAWSDSSLSAAGGFSYDMGFWWYIEWPQDIAQRTLRFVSSNVDGTLVTINALEYASLIINYVAATYVLMHLDPLTTDPHPVVLFYADNTAAESWMKKASSSSEGARALCRLHPSSTNDQQPSGNLGEPSVDNGQRGRRQIFSCPI